ncbi:MAG: SoxR reducing system RseC family protein [Bacteroidaceae bacterium]|nr:SoxR reducing system RseC family protein [Bacteroidaceae bacterium]
MKDRIISHDGIVKAVEGEHVRVRILQASACAGCAAKQMCSSAEAKEKEVDVVTRDATRYSAGQQVVLEGRLADGRMAAIIAYGLPLVVMLVVLVLAIQLTGSEALGALWALGSVAAYYAVVFLFFRQRLQRQFSFQIHESAE